MSRQADNLREWERTGRRLTLFLRALPLILIWCLSLFFASPAEARVGVKHSAQSYAADEVLVKFKSGVAEDTITSIFRAHDLVPSKSVRHKVKYGETLGGLAQKYMKDSRRFGAIAQRNKIKDPNKISVGQIIKIPSRQKSRIRRIDVHSTKIPAGKTVSGITKLLKARSDVLYAEPNYLHQMAAPDDPHFNEQWGFSNTGQFGGTPGADINAIPAWNIERGSSSTIIAVIDTGIDLNHEDLTANIWSNPGEIPGNGIDDDGNGLIDDERGWDFSDDDNLPEDYDGHGTHVAGIIAAVGDNSTGISGVCRNCRIMPLKIFPNAYSDICAQAIIYAADNGARIISNSWGGAFPSSVIRDAISYANSKGVLAVFAAGNNNSSNPFYPAYYPEVIAVAATDDSDKRASFSNFGDWIDVSAPGNHIYSSILNNSYGFMDGTSMACPFVSGLAGLIISQVPSLSAGQLRSRIENSAHSIDSLNPGYEGLLGSGRIDAYSALTAAPDTSPPTGSPTTPTDEGEYSESVTITFNWTKGSSEDPESGISGYYLQVGTYPGGNDKFDGSVGNVLSQSISGCENGKTYYARVRAVNGAGLYGQWSANSDGITIQAVAVGEIEVNYTFSPPRFVSAQEEGWDYWKIRMTDTLRFSKPGEPVVPMRTAKILIPQGEEVESIFVVPGNKVLIEGNYKIEYGKKPWNPKLVNFVEAVPNDEIYQSTSPFPGSLKGKYSTHFMVGYRILIVNLFPVQYIPASDELYYYESLKIVVDTVPLEREPVGIVPCRNVQKDVTRVQKFVDNPNLTQSYTKKVQPQTSYDYIIITDDSLLDAFQPLIDQKISRGYTARIVTTTWIYANYDPCGGRTGDDCNAAKIREFIKTTAYPTWGVQYVLLGGDDDTGDGDGAVLPIRHCYVYIDADTKPYIPCDLYYGALDTTGGTYDWDNDGDGQYGEDGEMDYLAEVYIGRMCAELSTEVTSMVNKTIAYENQYNSKKALLIAQELWPTYGIYGSESREYIWQYYPDDWTRTRVYENDRPRDYSFTKTNVINQMQSGDYNIVSHDGHGDTWCIGSVTAGENDKVTTSDVDLLTNTTYFFMYSLGCYTNAFDNLDGWDPDIYGADSVSEQLVKNSSGGAFAYIGETRDGWYPGGAEFEINFFDAVFGEGILNIGYALQDAKEELIGTVETLGGTYLYTYYSINLLGDPETPLRWGVDISSPIGAPSTPTDQGEVGSPTLVFDWTSGTLQDAESGIEGYFIQVSTDSSYWVVGDIKYSGYAGDVLTAQVGYCVHGSTYYARVRGRNGSGMYSAWSGVSDGIYVSTYPDLTLSSLDIMFSDENPGPNTVIIISATIRNSGGNYGNVGTNIALYPDYAEQAWANSCYDTAYGGYRINDGVTGSNFTCYSSDALGTAMLTIDLKQVRTITQWAWIADGIDGNANIPGDFTFSVSMDGSTWHEIDLVTGNTAAAYNPPPLDLPVEGRHIFMDITDTRGSSFVQFNEIYVYSIAETPQELVEFFNGDPDSGGSLIGSIQSIIPVMPGGTRLAAVEWTTPGTPGDYDIYVRLDNSGQVAEHDETNNISSRTITVVADVTAPGKITDFSAVCTDDYTVDLDWSSPGDDNFTGILKPGSTYYIEYKKYDGGWSTDNAQIKILAAWTEPYVSKSTTVVGLDGDTIYYFRIWTCDEIPNWSIVSDAATAHVTGAISTPTLRMGLDRHTFYDDEFYWRFYINIAGDVVYSTCAGTSGFAADFGGEVKVNDAASSLTSMGIWEDGEFVFVTYSDGTNAYARKITISNKGMGSETPLDTNTANHMQIITDSAGGLWRKGEKR